MGRPATIAPDHRTSGDQPACEKKVIIQRRHSNFYSVHYSDNLKNSTAAYLNGHNRTYLDNPFLKCPDRSSCVPLWLKNILLFFLFFMSGIFQISAHKSATAFYIRPKGCQVALPRKADRIPWSRPAPFRRPLYRRPLPTGSSYPRMPSHMYVHTHHSVP